MGVKLSVGLEQKSVSEGLGLLGMPEAWFAVASLVRYRKGSPKGPGMQDGGSAGVGEDGAPPLPLMRIFSYEKSVEHGDRTICPNLGKESKYV